MILAIHAIATFYMLGVIWFVQLTHYPLFGFVDEARYPEFQAEHMRRTGWVVGVPMIIEILSAAWLALIQESLILSTLSYIGLALVIVIWITTAVLQVPLHGRLKSKSDKELQLSLVRTNWLRTILWTIRGVLVCWMLILSLQSQM